jgi:subtilisin family serine protease
MTTQTIPGRAGWLTIIVASLLLLAAPTSALALDGGDGQWEPGKLLVRFHDGVGAAERDRIISAAGTQLDQELPLVPNLFELTTEGKVEAALSRLESHGQVEYAQPDYLDDEVDLASQSDLSYWPDDPYFWPTKFTNPNECTGQGPLLAGWPLWPLGQNLTDSSLPAREFNPVPSDKRATVRGGRPSLAIYDSINVMPVWNLLRDQAKLGGAGAGWTEEDIRRFGVGVIDDGIASHPDLMKQVAAEFSVVDSKEGGKTRTLVREFYTSNPARDDLKAVRAEIPTGGARETMIEDAQRDLFDLDDVTGFGVDYDSKLARQEGREPYPERPKGCSGHGTAVASLVTARGDNHIGTVGAGFNLPVIGLRQGMPWDAPGVTYAKNDGLDLLDAVSAWRHWEPDADYTDADRIDLYAIATALKLPVVNMSYGGPMLTAMKDATGKTRPVILRPAMVEALGRMLSTGSTLGIAAAGNRRENYGAAPSGAGAQLYNRNGRPGIKQPCGIKLIPKLGVMTEKEVGDPPRKIAEGEYAPDIDWSKIELLCVAATSNIQSKLTNFSASGDGGIQLAAPGENVTVATRPSWKDPDGGNAYESGDGTSYAAPLVAGAAALLRRAAPGAPIDMIRRALEAGARMNLNLEGKVLDGSLDVACSLKWLTARREPNWQMLPINAQVDPKAYADFAAATSGCGSRRPYVSSNRLELKKSVLYTNPNFESIGEFVKAIDPHQQADSVARQWQDLIIDGDDDRWNGGLTVFPIGTGGFFHPVSTAALAHPLTVYRAGLVDVSCGREGYVITGVSAVLPMIVRPSGWVFPTNAKAPKSEIEFAIAFAKPWYSAAVDSTVTVRVSAICQYFPQVTK